MDLIVQLGSTRIRFFDADPEVGVTREKAGWDLEFYVGRTGKGGGDWAVARGAFPEKDLDAEVLRFAERMNEALEKLGRYLESM